MLPVADETERLGPRTVIDALRRRWYVILLCALLTPTVTYLVVSHQSKRYEATSKLLFGNGPGPGTSDVDPNRAAATNRDLIALPAVAYRTAQALGGKFTADGVAAQISTVATTDSDVFSITASGKDPEETAKVADAYAHAFVAYRVAKGRAGYARTRAVLQKEIDGLAKPVPPPKKPDKAGKPAKPQPPKLSADAQARLKTLRGRVVDLTRAETLEDGGVEVIQAAHVPKKAVAPRPKVVTIVGLGLGLMLGVVLALLLAAIDSRLRTLDSTATAFDRPVLGAIPRSRALRRQSRSRPGGLPGGEVEAFRMLRANLRYSAEEHGVATVLVTSASLSEGKSTVAWNLAAAAADAGSRVLLIEADMRRPVLAKRFSSEAEGKAGLSDLLGRGLKMTSVRRQVALERFTGNGDAAKMDVIFAGAPISNPVDPIESDRMSALIGTARKTYDLIVVDSPPVSVVPDAIPLIRLVDGVIVVSRVGRTTRDAAEHVQTQLSNLGAPMLGVVVNGILPNEGHYGYAYEAAAGRRKRRPSPDADQDA